MEVACQWHELQRQWMVSATMRENERKVAKRMGYRKGLVEFKTTGLLLPLFRHLLGAGAVTRLFVLQISLLPETTRKTICSTVQDLLWGLESVVHSRVPTKMLNIQCEVHSHTVTHILLSRIFRS